MSIETPWDPASRRAFDARASTLLSGVCTGGGDGIDAAAASSCGPRHEVNEDAHSPLAAGSTLYVVADGVGGGALASTASAELVAQLHAALDGRPVDRDSLRRAVRAADQRIATLIAERSALAGAATVALCCPAGATPAEWLIAWVGDCRIYQVAPGARQAELLTVDDTYEQLGEPVPSGGSGHDPARMVGNGAVGEPNTRAVRLGPGELLLLCSDGVHKHVGADEIALQLIAKAPLAERCARLVSLARHRGSHDDATVLAVQRHFTPGVAAAVARATAPTVVLGATEAPAAPKRRGRWPWLLAGLGLLAVFAWLQLQPAEPDDDAEPLPSAGAPAAEPPPASAVAPPASAGASPPAPLPRASAAGSSRAPS